MSRSTEEGDISGVVVRREVAASSRSGLFWVVFLDNIDSPRGQPTAVGFSMRTGIAWPAGSVASAFIDGLLHRETRNRNRKWNYITFLDSQCCTSFKARQ